MSCDRKVSYQEDIDVATLFRLKPRVISLEPISRQGRKRSKRKEKIPDAATDKDSTIGRANSTDAEAPQSPSHSDMSYDSCPSSCGTGSIVDSNAPSIRTGDSKISKMLSSQTKPVTATIELQKAGFLRGDPVPVKIHVYHTKHIKSLHGVIVTLYRQARVDVNPPLPKVGSTRAEESPKSRTGIGLSITGAGASHLFRKDLSQSFASLIIDPSTLSAEIKATVRIPEEAFPTISTVPGAMITFKYYVEVVLDLQGKLAGLDRFLPNAGMAGISSHTGDPATGSQADASTSVFAAWGGHFMDTEEIRRDKSVVSCIFEIIIGTRDSERKGKWKQLVQTNKRAELPDANDVLGKAEEAGRQIGQHIQWAEPNNTQDHTNGSGLPTVPLPPNAAADNKELTEKERIRQAEQRLLPSSPPDSNEAASSAALHAPSAPILHDSNPPAFPQMAPEYFGPSAPPPPQHRDHNDNHSAQPTSAPAYEPRDLSSQVSTAVAASATDDKHELQRQRLESERSAPDDVAESDADEMAAAGPSAPAPAAFAPSVPSFDDVDDFEFADAGEHSLPRYER